MSVGNYQGRIHRFVRLAPTDHIHAFCSRMVQPSRRPAVGPVDTGDTGPLRSDTLGKRREVNVGAFPTSVIAHAYMLFYDVLRSARGAHR